MNIDIFLIIVQKHTFRIYDVQETYPVSLVIMSLRISVEHLMSMFCALNSLIMLRKRYLTETRECLLT